MNSYSQIVARLGEPNSRWPKHRGHLKNKDRFRLVAFLVVNKVPQDIIRRYGESSAIRLRDKAAKQHWNKLVTDLHENAAYRSKYSAYSLLDGLCKLDGTRVVSRSGTAVALETKQGTIITLINLL